jgi:hypothetical protein
MTIIGSFTKNDKTISYEITDEQQRKIIDRLIQYYAAPNHSHNGDGILADEDDSMYQSPDVLADICDNIIEFKEN